MRPSADEDEPNWEVALLIGSMLDRRSSRFFGMRTYLRPEVRRKGRELSALCMRELEGRGDANG